MCGNSRQIFVSQRGPEDIYNIKIYIKDWTFACYKYRRYFMHQFNFNRSRIVKLNRPSPFLAKTNKRNLLVRATYYRFDESTDISSSTTAWFAATLRGNLIHHLVNNHNRSRLSAKEKKRKKKKKHLQSKIVGTLVVTKPGEDGDLRRRRCRLPRDFSRCGVAELWPNCHSSGGTRGELSCVCRRSTARYAANSRRERCREHKKEVCQTVGKA